MIHQRAGNRMERKRQLRDSSWAEMGQGPRVTVELRQPFSYSRSPLAPQPPGLHPPPQASKSHSTSCPHSPPRLCHLRSAHHHCLLIRVLPRPQRSRPRLRPGAAPRCMKALKPGHMASCGISENHGTRGTRGTHGTRGKAATPAKAVTPAKAATPGTRGTPGTHSGNTRARPPPNGSPTASAEHTIRPSWTVTVFPTRPGSWRKRTTTKRPTGHP